MYAAAVNFSNFLHRHEYIGFFHPSLFLILRHFFHYDFILVLFLAFPAPGGGTFKQKFNQKKVKERRGDKIIRSALIIFIIAVVNPTYLPVACLPLDLLPNQFLG